MSVTHNIWTRSLKQADMLDRMQEQQVIAIIELVELADGRSVQRLRILYHLPESMFRVAPVFLRFGM